MKLFKAIALLAGSFALAACDSDNNNNNNNNDPDPAPPPATFDLQVLHGSPDAPPVNVFVDGAEALSDVDYKAGSAALELEVKDTPYAVRVDGILPGDDAAVITADLTFEADTTYTVVAVNDVANIEPVVIR